MYIRRIVARKFRMFEGEVIVDEIGKGLTVIVGDNEEGKSTLLKAVQAALFERYSRTGKVLEDMLPAGQAVRPEIELDFDMGTGLYRLHKCFGQRPSAELDGPDGRWQDDAVEEKLQELLRFTPAQGRARSGEAHRGLAGLLWVEQGQAFQQLEINEESRSSLTDAISGEVGQVLGGERGRKLVEAAETKYREYYTPGQGRPRGRLKETVEQADDLNGQIEILREQLRNYDQDVVRLESARRDLADLEDPETLSALIEKKDRAEERQREIQDLQNALRDTETNRRVAEAQAKTPLESLKTRQKLIEDADNANKELAQLLKEQKKEQESLERLADEEKSTRKKRDDSEAARGRAQAMADAARRAVERARLTGELRALSDRLDKAVAAEKGAVLLEGQAAAIRVDEKAIKKLRTMNRKVDTAQATLMGAATSLDFAPEGTRAVTAAGKDVAIDQPLRVTEETELALEGFGRVIVKPGGGELATLRSALAEAELKLSEALSRVGAAALAEAEDMAANKTRLNGESAGKRSEIGIHAPEGIEELRGAVALKTAELAAAERGTTSPATGLEASVTEEKAADEALTEAKKAFDTTNQQWEAARDRVSAAETELAELRGRLSTKDGETQRLTSQLAAVRAEVSDADLEAAVADSKNLVERAQGGEAKAKADLDAANPEDVALALKAATDARTNHQDAISQLRERTSGLEGRLGGLGEKGLGEDLERLEGEYEAAVVEQDRIARDAAAWKLLSETLTQAEREAQERFMEPIRMRVRPYLRRLFPADSEIVLDDDNLEITHLKRDGREERFDQLSLGTREQIAVLTRLAFADLLREAGQPVALILDDPLVNTDDPRFERMERALRSSAQNVQLIVLTCHAKRYLGLGAPMIRLADCVVGG